MQDPRITRLVEAERIIEKVHTSNYVSAAEEIRNVLVEKVKGIVINYLGERRAELDDLMKGPFESTPPAPDARDPDGRLNPWDRNEYRHCDTWRGRVLAFVRGLVEDLQLESEVDDLRSAKPRPGERGDRSTWRESPDLPGLAWNASLNEIRWSDRLHQLSTSQAALLKVIIQESRGGPTDPNEDHLLEEAGLKGKRFRDYFKTHELWGKLIVRGSKKGTVRLNVASP